MTTVTGPVMVQRGNQFVIPCARPLTPSIIFGGRFPFAHLTASLPMIDYPVAKIPERLLGEGLVDVRCLKGMERNASDFLLMFNERTEDLTRHSGRVFITATEAFLLNNSKCLLEERVVESVVAGNAQRFQFPVPSGLTQDDYIFPLWSYETADQRAYLNDVSSAMEKALRPAIEKNLFLGDVPFKDEMQFGMEPVFTATLRGYAFNRQRPLMRLSHLRLDGNLLPVDEQPHGLYCFDTTTGQIISARDIDIFRGGDFYMWPGYLRIYLNATKSPSGELTSNAKGIERSLTD